MKVNKEQIDVITSFIIEGEALNNCAPEGKKKYLFDVYQALSSILHNNKDNDSTLPEQICIPKYIVSGSGVDVDPNYPDSYVETTIKVLKEIRDNYFKESQLSEVQKQTYYERLNLIVTSISSFINTLKTLVL